MIPEIEQLKSLDKKFQEYHKLSLPLCAAENVISDFVKWPLSVGYQERYIMGSAYDFTMNDNFIGADMLYPYYQMVSKLGKELFHADFTDVRTLTGMNAANMIASALIKPNDNIMILGKQWGGHASMRPTFERLGANVFDAPYNLDDYDFDYDQLNKEIKEKNIKFLSIAPSDILFEQSFEHIDDSNCVILFDYSQILGLIAAGLAKNPLDSKKNAILFGGTHKTIPGPAHGIILTNNEELFKILDKEINPKYLRNVQTHQVLSLLCTLIEMKYYGHDYQANTVRMGNLLGAELEKLGFNIVKRGDCYTQTHQLFLEMSEENMKIMFNNAIAEHVTLNTKKKPLFHGGYGIRLGVQEISRYNWDDSVIHNVAIILAEIAKQDYSKETVRNLMAKLPEKKVHFTFDSDQWKDLRK